MIKSGLVTKTTLESDKRHNVISITDLGIQVKNKSNKVALETLEIALDGFTETEIVALNSYLSRIKKNLIR